MIISNAMASQPSVPDSRFKTAGWICFLDMILSVPTVVVGFLTQPLPPILIIYIPLVVIGNGIMIYVLVQFRRLLNERYDFHGIDKIIIAQIVISLVMASVDVLVKIAITLVPPAGILAIIPFVGIIIPGLLVVGILGIIRGVRLLTIRDDLTGLLRPYAIIGIVSSSCEAAIILLPITWLLMIPSSAILGMIFLRAAEAEAQVEFV